jgi:hypothetical protein
MGLALTTYRNFLHCDFPILVIGHSSDTAGYRYNRPKEDVRLHALLLSLNPPVKEVSSLSHTTENLHLFEGLSRILKRDMFR